MLDDQVMKVEQELMPAVRTFVGNDALAFFDIGVRSLKVPGWLARDIYYCICFSCSKISN